MIRVKFLIVHLRVDTIEFSRVMFMFVQLKLMTVGMSVTYFTCAGDHRHQQRAGFLRMDDLSYSSIPSPTDSELVQEAVLIDAHFFLISRHSVIPPLKTYVSFSMSQTLLSLDCGGGWCFGLEIIVDPDRMYKQNVS